MQSLSLPQYILLSILRAKQREFTTSYHYICLLYHVSRVDEKLWLEEKSLKRAEAKKKTKQKYNHANCILLIVICVYGGALFIVSKAFNVDIWSNISHANGVYTFRYAHRNTLHARWQ